jgi:hypothetical protein
MALVKHGIWWLLSFPKFIGSLILVEPRQSRTSFRSSFTRLLVYNFILLIALRFAFEPSNSVCPADQRHHHVPAEGPGREGQVEIATTVTTPIRVTVLATVAGVIVVGFGGARCAGASALTRMTDSTSDGPGAAGFR